MNDNLDTLNDAELNEAFAVEVAGWLPRWHIFKRGLYFRPNAAGYTSKESEAGLFTEEEAKAYEYPHDEPVTIRRAALGQFSTDANAVLPWLEKYDPVSVTWTGKSWAVTIMEETGSGETYDVPTIAEADAASFATAACIALLRAKRSTE